jgi:hypothetical protein
MARIRGDTNICIPFFYLFLSLSLNFPGFAKLEAILEFIPNPMCIDHENFVGAIRESPLQRRFSLYDIASLFEVDLVLDISEAPLP